METDQELGAGTLLTVMLSTAEPNSKPRRVGRLLRTTDAKQIIGRRLVKCQCCSIPSPWEAAWSLGGEFVKISEAMGIMGGSVPCVGTRVAAHSIQL